MITVKFFLVLLSFDAGDLCEGEELDAVAEELDAGDLGELFCNLGDGRGVVLSPNPDFLQRHLLPTLVEVYTPDSVTRVLPLTFSAFNRGGPMFLKWYKEILQHLHSQGPEVSH